MKNILLIAFLAFAGYQGWGMYQANAPIEPLSDESYVIVYGRDTCGWTRQALEKLAQSDVNYKYYKVDDQKVADHLHSRMRDANIPTGRYNLPVVDVNGTISVRPDMDDVLVSYNEKI